MVKIGRKKVSLLWGIKKLIASRALLGLVYYIRPSPHDIFDPPHPSPFQPTTKKHALRAHLLVLYNLEKPKPKNIYFYCSML